MADFDIAPVRIVGRYAVYEEIASGGMATVHIGRLRGAVGFAKTVAIKRLHPAYARNAEFVSMFVDEARLAARIRHPNVVQTLDVVAADGELFLVMEYIQGESLARLNRVMRSRNEQIPHGVINAVMTGALRGLQAAHDTKDEHGRSLELVHRDVSPQNIMVGIDGLSRVLDFGIARAAGRVHTSQSGKMKGKLGYIAPEQVESGVVTRQADIYSASVVLWELLTGRRLFYGDNQGTVVARVLAGDVPAPSTVVPGIPSTYDAVVLKGLSRDPGQRFATAREMADALESCGPSESLAGVAAWLEHVASDLLHNRATKLAHLERSADPSEVSALRAMVDELASGGGASSPESASAGSATPAPFGSDAGPELPSRAPARARRLRRMALTAVVIGIGGGAMLWLTATSKSGAPNGAGQAVVAPVLEANAVPVQEASALATSVSHAPSAAPAASEDAPSAASPASASAASSAPGDAATGPSPLPPARRSAPKRTSGDSAKQPSPFKGLGGRL